MKKASLSLLLGFILISSAFAQKKEVFHLSEFEKEFGYAQAVKIGDIVYFSGTVSGAATMEAQVEDIYNKIRRTLEHYGLTEKHIVKENIYTKDITALAAANEKRKAFYKGNTPAATWIQIDQLFSPQSMVEIEVTAHVNVE